MNQNSRSQGAGHARGKQARSIQVTWLASGPQGGDSCLVGGCGNGRPRRSRGDTMPPALTPAPADEAFPAQGLSRAGPQGEVAAQGGKGSWRRHG